jgi:DNA mismatch repair protein MutS
LLDAILLYCEALEALRTSLTAAPIRSRGLIGIRDHLHSYLAGDEFSSRRDQAQGLLHELDSVRYALLIKGARISVGPYDEETDYSAEVMDTFARFRRHVDASPASELPRAGMNHVDAQILDLVARLFPDLFGRLEAFCAGNGHFEDETIALFDRELQFYLAYLDYLAPLRAARLSVCYPAVDADSKQLSVEDTYDLALAAKLVVKSIPVVVNDLQLMDAERIVVVSGPNQGGKTTLARTFGQLYYLAGLGCPVPGRNARVLLADSVLTHFEREEDLDSLAGKLQDDLVRIRAILERATPRSVIVLNEVFASTTVEDALSLSKDILGRIEVLDALCLCVTFLDELSRLGPKTVSVVSTVVAEDPTQRTYKLVRRAADGRAYAVAIAEKYGLTYQALRERISR